MRILVVMQFYPFPGAGGVARFVELAKHWCATGHEVTVLASDIDHATGRAAQITEETEHPRLRVVRIPAWALDKRRSGGRILRDLSFAWRAAREGRRMPRPDVVVASSPPLFVGWAGRRIAAKHGVPLVFDVRDLWPDAAVQFGALGGLPARLAYRLEASIYRAAAQIIVVTPGFQRAITVKGVPAAKVHLVPNGADLDRFHPGPPDPGLRERLGWTGRVVLLYAGVLGPSQDLANAVSAAGQLRGTPLLLVLLGTGSERPALMAQAAGAPNVRFMDPVPRAEVAAMLRSCDLALVSLRRLETFKSTYPAKVFEAMACGAPVVAVGEGDLGELVQASRGGIAVPPEDSAALAQALADLLDPSARAPLRGPGAEYVAQHFDRAILAERYRDVLAMAVSPRS